MTNDSMVIYELGIAKNGIPLVSRRYYDDHNVKMDTELYSGLISGIDMFVKETFSDEIETFSLKSFKIAFYSQTLNPDDPDDIITAFCIGNKKFKISKEIDEFDNLKQNESLAKNNLNYFLSLLGLSSDSDWVKEKLKVTNRNSFRSYALPSYQNLVALAETFGKEDAIKLYKIFITEYVLIKFVSLL